MVNKVQFQATYLGTSEGYYKYFALEDKDADILFNHMKAFWTFREEETEAEIERRIEEYHGGSIFNPGLVELGDILVGTINEKLQNRRKRKSFSILELGGASGSLLHFLKSKMTAPLFQSIDYFGIEPFAKFVADLKKHFPEADAIVGDAEFFNHLPLKKMPRRHFDVFFSSVAFCMIKPSIVRKTIKKAAGIVDKFILFDMVTNTHGQLSKKNVIFDYNPPQSQYYFAHRFGDYLEDSGFGIKYCKELPFEHILAKKGYGVIIGEKL